MSLVLCPCMCSLPENVPYALEKNMYSFFFFCGCGFYRYWLYLLLYYVILDFCCLIHFLYGWSVHWCQWEQKFSTIVLLSIYLFMFVSICFMYFGIPVLCAYSLMGIISFSYIDPFIFVYCPFSLWTLFKVYFVWCDYCYLLFLVFPFVWNIFFHSLTFKLCISFTLGWISCRQYISGSFSF